MSCWQVIFATNADAQADGIEDGTADNAEKSWRPLPIPKNDTNTTMKGIVAIAKRPRKNVIPQDEVVKMR